jgi:hypothetical protein
LARLDPYPEKIVPDPEPKLDLIDIKISITFEKCYFKVVKFILITYRIVIFEDNFQVFVNDGLYHCKV